MAMTKKEQAEVAALRQELAIARAFTRTVKVLPDVAPPGCFWEGKARYSVGYLYSGYGGVEKAWSTSVTHGRGEVKTDGRSGSQNSCHLFSTPALALKAMRWEVEEKAAKELAKIDAMIAAAEGAE